MKLSRTIGTALAAALPLAAVAACGGDPTPPGGGQVLTADLQFITPAPTARPLVAQTVSFWAKKGDDREGRLYRAGGTGGEDDDFVRLRIRDETLRARPNGTPFAEGDSILITLTVIDPVNLLVEMSPSGLTFNPARPAELKFHFDEASDDLNRDGAITTEDNTLKTALQIWKREAPGEPWVAINGTLKIEVDEIEANLLSFTTYAVAYRSRVRE